MSISKKHTSHKPVLRNVPTAEYSSQEQSFQPLTRRSRAFVNGQHERIDDIPHDELTPRVQSVMSILMDEVDQLKTQLKRAHERVDFLENIADEDPLVPVLNRRGFMRELERGLAYIKRYKTQMSLLYIDVDHFKSINDTYGHAAGDEALCYVGKFLLNFVRRSDVVGRLGGDEFAILLHQADDQSARIKAERLVCNIQKTPWLYNDQRIDLELSVGVAELHEEDSAVAALQRADSDMYIIRMARRCEGGPL